MKIVLLAVLIMAISVALLGVKVFFVKGGKFPNSHIHSNPAMRKMGITCAQNDQENIKKIHNKKLN